MKKIPIVYHPGYSIPFPADHRFVMSKFSRLYRVLQEEGLLDSQNHYIPEKIGMETILLAHEGEYTGRVFHGQMTKEELREMGLPYSRELVERVLSEVSGTILAGKIALQKGIACNAGGGTHHAHPSRASGFCIFNDVAVAIRVLQSENLIKKALIIDLDVHQGDGNSAFFGMDENVYVFSMHGEKNFPVRKVQSDLDIPLKDRMEDEEYLELLNINLVKIFENFRPDLVYYDAGIDVFMGDELGRLSLTEGGIYNRDIYVLKSCRERQIPVATVIGGGYDRDHDLLAKRHAIVFKSASEVF